MEIMPDDQNTTQKQDSEKNSIPASPQEPMADTSVSATDSTPSEMPSEAPESPKSTDIPVSLNNDNPENTYQTTENKVEMTENGQNTENIPLESTDLPANLTSNGTSPETPISSEPIKASETRTAQMAGNEPLKSESEPLSEPVQTKAEATPPPVNSGGTSEAKSEPEPEKIIPIVPVIVSNKNKIVELLTKAKNAIQFRKRKKLDKVMALFLKHKNITNDEVEKFLHISDATATRYLSQLEKEGKIKQNGKTGHAVSYSRI